MNKNLEAMEIKDELLEKVTGGTGQLNENDLKDINGDIKADLRHPVNENNGLFNSKVEKFSSDGMAKNNGYK